jgi:uncharacterized membrane protein/cytochrome c551/c552
MKQRAARACVSGLFALGVLGALVARADIPPGRPPPPPRPPGEAPAEAVALLSRHGCTGCHTVDGRDGAGPTFAGLRERAGFSPDLHVRDSIVDPSATIAPGYDDLMPAYTWLTEDDLDAVVEAVLAIPPADPPPTYAGLVFLGAMIAFVALHFSLSADVLRARLVAKLGEGAFQGAYSLVVAVPFVVALVTWSDVPYVPLWTPPRWASHLVLTLMLPALFFIVAGYTTKSPTVAGMAGAANEPPRGVLTITRHPALVGFTLWGLAHLVANGTLRDVAFFGALVVLSVGGMFHIDARRRRALPDAWPIFATRTSVFPFAAIVRRRVAFDGRGLLPRLAISLVLYAALALALHRWAFGVPVLPPEWGVSF